MFLPPSTKNWFRINIYVSKFFIYFTSRTCQLKGKPLKVKDSRKKFLSNDVDDGHCKMQIESQIRRGAMKQGRGTCSAFQSSLVILPNVPCTYYVHGYLGLFQRYVHIPRSVLEVHVPRYVHVPQSYIYANPSCARTNVPLSSARLPTSFQQPPYFHTSYLI